MNMKKKIISVITIGLVLFLVVKITTVSNAANNIITLGAIDIELKENGENNGELFKKLIPVGEKDFKIGKKYQENITVSNLALEAYVRVVINKNWYTSTGKIASDVSSKYIELEFNTNDWLLDENASNDERVVLYYHRFLNEGEETTSVIDSIKVNSNILNEVITKSNKDANGYETITTTYNYNDCQLGLEVVAEAIQEANIDSSVLTDMWGAELSINADGTLSFK